jgi:hypothetical protein
MPDTASAPTILSRRHSVATSGDWTTYGGGGYWINQGRVDDKNYWFFGALLQRKNH